MSHNTQSVFKAALRSTKVGPNLREQVANVHTETQWARYADSRRAVGHWNAEDKARQLRAYGAGETKIAAVRDQSEDRPGPKYIVQASESPYGIAYEVVNASDRKRPDDNGYFIATVDGKSPGQRALDYAKQLEGEA